jgi:hypothetical protein
MSVKKAMLQSAVIPAAVILFTIAIFFGSGFAADQFNIIAGEWQRTDGNYLIKVSDVKADGQATVGYFNPHSIHVAKAALSTQKDLIKLFIKFQDKGYEGSTYTLYYYAQKDSLLGFYYQAGTDKTYEVVFSRKAQ